MDQAIRKDLMLHAFMFTLSGIPVLYSGDEIAQENDNAYHEDPLRREDSRYLHRGNLDWSKAALRTDPDTPEGRIFASISRMESLRADHAVFDTEADTWLLYTESNQVLGVGRYYLGEQLLALFNFSDQEKTVWLHDDKQYTDLFTGESGDADAVKVPAGGFRWLLHTF